MKLSVVSLIHFPTTSKPHPPPPHYLPNTPMNRHVWQMVPVYSNTCMSDPLWWVWYRYVMTVKHGHSTDKFNKIPRRFRSGGGGGVTIFEYACMIWLQGVAMFLHYFYLYSYRCFNKEATHTVYLMQQVIHMTHNHNITRRHSVERIHSPCHKIPLSPY